MERKPFFSPSRARPYPAPNMGTQKTDVAVASLPTRINSHSRASGRLIVTFGLEIFPDVCVFFVPFFFLSG